MLELAPMKNGFSLIVRFLLCFLAMEIVATFLGAATPLLDSAQEKSASALVFWERYALESLPIAIAVAVYYTGFAATRKLKRRLSGYFLLYSLSLVLLGGGAYLSRSLPALPEPLLPPSTAISAREPSVPYFVRESGEDKASGIVYVPGNGKEPRLAWASSGIYLQEQGILLVDRTPLPLAAANGRASPSPVPGLQELKTWYRNPNGENLYIELAAAAGIAARICGLWPLSRLFRWHLIGAFASGSALLSLGYLVEIFRSPSVLDLTALIGLKAPVPLLVGMLSGACGLALVFLDFALCPSLGGASARRNRGRP